MARAQMSIVLPSMDDDPFRLLQSIHASISFPFIPSIHNINPSFLPFAKDFIQIQISILLFLLSFLPFPSIGFHPSFFPSFLPSTFLFKTSLSFVFIFNSASCLLPSFPPVLPFLTILMMFDFLRPVHDQTLRIMIPDQEKYCSSTAAPGSSRKQQQQQQQQHRNFNSPNGGQMSSCYDSEEDLGALSPSVRRHYKAYTVMQRSGFQHTEYVQILTHLCKAEVFISVLFLCHGLYCPGFAEQRSYQSTCHINVLSALVGGFTGGLGLGAVHRFRWRTMLVMWLIMCIISAVANLLAVITTGIWLDHLSKLKTRTGIVNGLSGLMLLGSVLFGVCFILTSVIICHYWASNSSKYQAVGRMAKRMRSLRRRTSRPGSGTERSSRMAHHSGGSVRHGEKAHCQSQHYQMECQSGAENSGCEGRSSKYEVV